MTHHLTSTFRPHLSFPVVGVPELYWQLLATQIPPIRRVWGEEGGVATVIGGHDVFVEFLFSPGHPFCLSRVHSFYPVHAPFHAANTQTNIHKHTHTHAHTHAHTYAHTHGRAFIGAHTCTHTHTHTRSTLTHLPSFFLPSFEPQPPKLLGGYMLCVFVCVTVRVLEKGLYFGISGRCV